MRISIPFLSAAIELFLPCRCPLCGVVVAEDHRFCLKCWQMLDFISEPWCTACGLPFAFDHGAGAWCLKCLDSPPEHDGVRAVVAYDSNSAKVALGLKYSAKLGLADLIAGHLQKYLVGIDCDSLFVPVPLHRRRLWERGFNQSALIAKSLSNLSGIKTNQNILVRKNATPPLKSMTAKKRAKILKDAIGLKKNAESEIQGRTVFLVDDVYTTGATANSCARQLKKGGAQSVIILCWARVLPDNENR